MWKKARESLHKVLLPVLHVCREVSRLDRLDRLGSLAVEELHDNHGVWRQGRGTPKREGITSSSRMGDAQACGARMREGASPTVAALFVHVEGLADGLSDGVPLHRLGDDELELATWSNKDIDCTRAVEAIGGGEEVAPTVGGFVRAGPRGGNAALATFHTDHWLPEGQFSTAPQALTIHGSCGGVG